MATLVVRDRKGNTVARLDVSPSRPVHAGRTAENELVLKENSVSRRHACFEYQEGRLIVRDMKSANGVLVAGVRIRGPKPVVAGDRVRIGSFDVEVLDEAGKEGAAEAASARLVALDGPYRGESFALDKEVVTVGRVAGNDIVLEDASISRRHAKITRSGSTWTVEDLGSSNGSTVGGGKITKSVLSDGDRVGFGDVMFQFKSTGGAAKRPAKASEPTDHVPSRASPPPSAALPARAAPQLDAIRPPPPREMPEPTPLVPAVSPMRPMPASGLELPTGPAPAFDDEGAAPAAGGRIVQIVLLLAGFFALAGLSAAVAWILTE
ncbi:MAG: FHA domain-containing protein [Deltaproteobacteria bacterium]|nr:FHA domain-containing protein [Deltaproteobacteria bacterium]